MPVNRLIAPLGLQECGKKLHGPKSRLISKRGSTPFVGTIIKKSGHLLDTRIFYRKKNGYLPNLKTNPPPILN